MRLYRIALKFIDNYRSLFLNPADNAAEIIVTTALIVIFAIIIWIMVGIVVRQSRLVVVRLRRDKNFPAIVMLYSGAVLISIAFLFAATLPISSNSSICGRACHSMNPSFQSWRRSAHAKVACSSCHMDDSLGKVLSEKVVNGTRNLRKEITGGYSKPINALSKYSQKQVPNSRCEKCHSPRKRFFSVRLGLSMDHPSHVAAGLRCTTCHNRVAHPEAEKYSPVKNKKTNFQYTDYLSMREGCWRCHRSKGKFVDASGVKHQGPFVAKSGKKAPTECGACHDTTWDELPKRHKPARGVKWGRGLAHGEVARRDYKQCKGCHEATVWCSTRCHFGVTMPHSAKWPQKHSDFARKDRKRCYACHKVNKELDFCGDRCHHESFQKKYNLDKKFAWNNGKEQHGVAVRATGGVPCFRCHQQNPFCGDCHGGTIMPHVSGWRRIHFKSVDFVAGDGWQRKEASCNACHNKDGRNSNYCSSCHHKKFGDYSPIGLMAYLHRTYKIGYDLINKGERLPCEDCHSMKWCRDCHYGTPDRNLTQG